MILNSHVNKVKETDLVFLTNSVNSFLICIVSCFGVVIYTINMCNFMHQHEDVQERNKLSIVKCVMSHDGFSSTNNIGMHNSFHNR